MSDVIFDCTELYQNPVRTGIQRVVREMLRSWPEDGPRLHVVRYDRRRNLIRLSAQAIRVLTDQDPGLQELSRDDIVARLADIDKAAPSEPLPADAIHFIPEVFYDPLRCRHYEWLMSARGRTVAMLAYDFIAFLKPQLFNMRSCVSLTEYLRLIAGAPHVAHISEATRRDYERRILYGRGPRKGPVLPLGADGLKMERQKWCPDRKTFVALGSIDQRKNQHLTFEAMRQLWDEGCDVPLTLIGQAFKRADIAWIEEASLYPQFRWLDQASDEDIRRELSSARCTIYVSEAEGYGLPPVESIWAGIPVISTVNMPSLEGLPANGSLRISCANAKELRGAVEFMLDDANAKNAWLDTGKLELATWRDFARHTADWLADIKTGVPPPRVPKRELL